MKLIVGLGNPGREYEKTRHNIGFMLVDKYLNSKFKNIEWKVKFNGSYFQTVVFGEKTIFLKPLSYMNLSGEVVKKFVDYFKINVDDILIISDDMDLNIGNFKLKDHGSCGGHNGLRNVELYLGTNCYKRLKIGISKRDFLDAKDYVLGTFSKEELNKLDNLFDELIPILDQYFSLKFSDLMSRYNHKNR